MTGSDASADERIVRAAMTLISEQGMSGVSMSDVARAAGVARQTLYNHYPDVESIVLTMLERHEAESLGQLRAFLETIDSPIAKIEHVVRQAVVTVGHAHQSAAWKVGLSAEAQARLRRHSEAVLAVIVEVLEDGKQQGIFRDDLEPELDARLIEQMVATAGELAAEHGRSAAAVASATTRTILLGLGASV